MTAGEHFDQRAKTLTAAASEVVIRMTANAATGKRAKSQNAPVTEAPTGKTGDAGLASAVRPYPL